MSVLVKKSANTALVIIDNPPVNALGVEQRAGLMDAVQSVSQYDDVDRVILTGHGNIFAAGADAREFNADPVAPHLPDVVAAIENSNVPWIAAINGSALGGGAELVLSCRYRVMSPKAKIGLPEVKLGVVPGAGGTQRLPRLVGMEKALQLISQGEIISASQAKDIGLVDVVTEDPVQFSSSLDMDRLVSIPPVSELTVPPYAEEVTKKYSDRVQKKMHGQIAPVEAIRLVSDSAIKSFDEGMKEERNVFLKLRKSSQSNALRHIFFAERKAKAPEWLTGTEPYDVKKAVVVGGGNMGSSIAYAMDMAGIETTILETSEEAAGRARVNLSKLVDKALQLGKIGAKQAEIAKQRLRVITDYSELGNIDLAIEAVFEDMAIKENVLKALEAALPENAVLATNTSYLDVNKLGETLENPARLVGLHFFSPAHLMKLLEIVRGERTSDKVLATSFVLAEKMKKIPVLSGVCEGFIGNRILKRYREAADTLLMDGSTPWDIDEAMVDFGYPMGPYQAQDLSGLDIAYANREKLRENPDKTRRYIPIADRMVNEGRLGRKNGVGWYRYTASGEPIVDPLVEDLVREEAHFAGVERREFSKSEIQERLLIAMINEACDILHEGIAQSATDIDLVLVFGYGFPSWRGGLLHYAQQVGYEKILDRLNLYCNEDPVVWKPSPFLKN